MSKIISIILIAAFLLSGSPASAEAAPARQPSMPGQDGALEPLIQFEYKNPFNLVSDGRYVYVDSLFDPGAEVMILDALDPAHPIEIASMPINIDSRLLAVTSDILYMGQNYGGILTYDVSNPTNPGLIGEFEPVADMFTNQIVISGTFAYIADSTLGLAVMDITDPAHPTLLGANSEESIYRLALQGQSAYALAGNTLILYDISNPAHPVLLGRYENPSHLPDVFAVNGNYAYLSGSIHDDQGNTIGYFTDVIDISDPGNPELVTDLPQLAEPIKQLIVHDHLLYVLNWNELAIYNAADPVDPQLAGVYPSITPMSLVLQGDKALFLDNATGVHVLDISNPAHPVKISAYSWPQEAGYLTSLGTDVYTVDNSPISFPTFEERSILRVINAADPFNAHVNGFLVLDDMALGTPYVDGSYIYFPGDRGVSIIDITDPINLRVVARTGASFTSMVEVHDSVAYSISMDIGGSGGYFTINDVSNPVSPTQLSQSIYINPRDMSITSQGENIYAYIISNGSLVILDVTDPASPLEVYRETTALGYGLIDTEKLGAQTIAFLTGSRSGYDESGIIALDVSDPAHPVYLGTFLQAGIDGAIVFEAQDGIVFFSIEYEYDGALVLIDFSDPVHPRLTSSAKDPGGVIRDASLGKKYLYTTVGYSPITVFSMTGDLNGRVTDPNYNPVTGITLTLSTGEETLTGADGAYLFPDLDFGDYVVTPTLGTYAFSPERRDVNIPSDWVSQDFVILPAPVSTLLEPGIATTLTYTDVQGLPTSFFFPSGLVSSTATALVTPTLTTGFFGHKFAGHAFELSIDSGLLTNPDGQFSVPVSVTIQYSLEDTAGITDTTRLALYRSDGSTWTEANASCAPTSSPLTQNPGVFEGVICQEGLYALFGPTYGIALPIVSYGSVSQTCEPPDCIPLPPLSDQE